MLPQQQIEEVFSMYLPFIVGGNFKQQKWDYSIGGLNDLCNESKKAEIGFWLLQENWGKGIMIEAMPLIIKYSFNNLGLKRLEGLVETKNRNCIKALKKLNFNLENTRVDCEVKNGKKISLDVYTKLNG